MCVTMNCDYELKCCNCANNGESKLKRVQIALSVFQSHTRMGLKFGSSASFVTLQDPSPPIAETFQCHEVFWIIILLFGSLPFRDFGRHSRANQEGERPSPNAFQLRRVYIHWEWIVYGFIGQ